MATKKVKKAKDLTPKKSPKGGRMALKDR